MLREYESLPLPFDSFLELFQGPSSEIGAGAPQQLKKKDFLSCAIGIVDLRLVAFRVPLDESRMVVM